MRRGDIAQKDREKALKDFREGTSGKFSGTLRLMVAVAGETTSVVVMVWLLAGVCPARLVLLFNSALLFYVHQGLSEKSTLNNL